MGHRFLTAFPDILQWRTLQVAPTYSGRTVQDFHLVPSYPLRWAKELELKDIYLYYSISTPVPEFLLSFFYYDPPRKNPPLWMKGGKLFYQNTSICVKYNQKVP